jgi:hypothetical protein
MWSSSTARLGVAPRTYTKKTHVYKAIGQRAQNMTTKINRLHVGILQGSFSKAKNLPYIPLMD